MSFKASGTLRSVLTLCLALSTSISPVLSAPALTEDTSPWIPRSLQSLFEPRAASNLCGGTGLYITNKGSGTQSFTVFGGGAEYNYAINSAPIQTVTLAKGQSKAVPLTVGFEGHVQRGNLLPATWVELNMKSGASDGDVSLEIGCDGAVEVQASAWGGGGTPPVFGFSKDIVSGAPADALYQSENIGSSSSTGNNAALDATWYNGAVLNAHALAWEQEKGIAQEQAYLQGGVGTGQAIASDNCLLVTFY